jgi:hypothetical protein
VNLTVGHLGGIERCLLKHLRRWGGEASREALHTHLVLGKHKWSQRDFELAIERLVELGIITPPDQAGVLRTVMRPPL